MSRPSRSDLYDPPAPELLRIRRTLDGWTVQMVIHHPPTSTWARYGEPPDEGEDEEVEESGVWVDGHAVGSCHHAEHYAMTAPLDAEDGQDLGPPPYPLTLQESS